MDQVLALVARLVAAASFIALFCFCIASAFCGSYVFGRTRRRHDLKSGRIAQYFLAILAIATGVLIGAWLLFGIGWKGFVYG